MGRGLRDGLGAGSCLLALACSSGGGGSGGPSGGVFLDSAVGGLGFSSGILEGLTDAGGAFQSDGTAPVVFHVGDIELGTAPLQAVVTPVDLVPGASDETHPTVTNIARLLQTLDTDEDPDNGIAIDPVVTAAAAMQSLDFTLGTAAFEAAAQPVVDVLTAGLPGGSRPLIPILDAQQHLASTLLGSVAGRYDGTLAGDDSGPFRVYVNRSGVLYGYAVSAFDGLLGLSGSTSSDGGFVAGVVSSSATFDGEISADGTLAGTWELLPETGTFSGWRVAGVDPDLDQALLASLVGTYEGTFVTPFETGPVTVVLDASGDLTAPPPDDELAATVVSTAGGEISFAGLAIDGTLIAGTIDALGNMSGTLLNEVDPETGTFTATLVP